MTTDAGAADTGALSISEAIASVTQPEAPETPAETVEVSQPETAEIQADAPAADNASEAEQPGDGEQQQEDEQAEAIKLNPPTWWSKEAKAKFAELPPDVQAEVYRQEENRERVTQKAKQDAAEATKSVQTKQSEYDQRIQRLNEMLPQAEAMVKGKWAKADWPALAQSLDPADYQRLKAEYDRDVEVLNAAKAEAEAADKQKFAAWQREEAGKLKEVAPDLVDEKTGRDTSVKVAQFVTTLGYGDRIPHMDANEWSIAYDAMRWREAQKNTAALAAKPKPQTQPQRPGVVKPTSPPAVTSNRSQALISAQNAFNKDPSLRNAQALELAKLQG